ncbi:cytochrome P450 family protein [Streptomyces sp. NPDC054871]
MPAPALEDLAPEGHDLAIDPYPLYAALRAESPVRRVSVPGSGEAWLVLARDAARVALTDARLRNDIRYSSSWQTDGGHAIGRNMLQSDPPQHTRLRRLVAGHFTPGRIAELRPRIEAVADDLLAALPPQGTADLVSQYALPLPVAVICDLLGVPAADRALFHTWSNELVMPTSEETAASAGTALAGYLTELIDRKSKDPDGTLLSELALLSDPAAEAAPPESGGLTAEELLGMAFLILVAGHETTVDLISGTLHALLAHPDQLALLRADPGLTGGAVEESLRYNSPVHASAFRFAAEPLDLAGTRIAAGDTVQVSLAAASRDPLHFPEPDRFDIRRRAQGHLGFGHGLHHCLGAPLARAEAEIAVRRLLTQRPGLAFAADPAALTWRTSALLRGLTELPLSLGPSGRAIRTGPAGSRLPAAGL